MNILLVFRGENLRFRNDTVKIYDNGSDWLDIRRCIPNNKVRIIESLRSAGHTVDIMFCTYESEHLTDFVDAYLPKYIHLFEHSKLYNAHHVSVSNTLNSILPVHTQYDRIILLRYDLLYKKNITDWPIWYKNGVIVPWKVESDEAYERRKWCNDHIIIIDSTYFPTFNSVFQDSFKQYNGVTSGIHFITDELYKNGTVPFYFMERIVWSGDSYSTDTSDSMKCNPYTINSLYPYAFSDLHLTYV
jgi:hypothetical protein